MGKNLTLTESQNVTQLYEVTCTTGAAHEDVTSLVFDRAFSEVPDVMSIYIKDTDGTLANLVSRVAPQSITTSGLDVLLMGLYDGNGEVNIGVHTFTVVVIVHGKF